MRGDRIEVVKASLEYIVTELKPFDFLGDPCQSGVGDI